MATERGRASSGIGGSLILIIFIILTVTIFSVLTLVSAQNEIATVKKTADISKNTTKRKKRPPKNAESLKPRFRKLRKTPV